MSPADADQTLTRIKLWAGAGAVLMGLGFAAAMFLVTHYASAADLKAVDDKVGTANDKIDGVAGQVQEHRALIDSMKEDLKYLRDGVDELRRRR